VAASVPRAKGGPEEKIRDRGKTEKNLERLKEKSLAMDGGGTISSNKRKRFAANLPAEVFDAIEAQTRTVLAEAGDPPAPEDSATG